MYFIRLCILFLSISFFWSVSVTQVHAQATTDRVIIVVLDGMRADAVSATSTPFLHRLATQGSVSLTAQTIFPSKTLPAIVSLVSGVAPQIHGVRTNNPLALLEFSGDTIFSLAKERNYSTGAIVSKKDVAPLAVPWIFDYVRFPKRVKNWPVERVVKEFREIISVRPVNVLVVHFNEPDITGHKHGWMTKKYFKAVKNVDKAIGKIVADAEQILGKKSYTLLITADHGGNGKKHGTRAPQDMTIPLIAWGKGVKAGAPIESPNGILDVAPTTLWLLGISIPTYFQGRALVEMFD